MRMATSLTARHLNQAFQNCLLKIPIWALEAVWQSVPLTVCKHSPGGFMRGMMPRGREQKAYGFTPRPFAFSGRNFPRLLARSHTYITAGMASRGLAATPVASLSTPWDDASRAGSASPAATPPSATPSAEPVVEGAGDLWWQVHPAAASAKKPASAVGCTLLATTDAGSRSADVSVALCRFVGGSPACMAE
jgi:hypothetical protein